MLSTGVLIGLGICVAVCILALWYWHIQRSAALLHDDDALSSLADQHALAASPDMPLKAAILARRSSCDVQSHDGVGVGTSMTSSSSTSAPLVSGAQRVLARLLQPMLGRAEQEEIHEHAGSSYASTIPTGGSYQRGLTFDTPDPISPFSPLHSHPYTHAHTTDVEVGKGGTGTYQQMPWHTADDLQTPDQNYRTLTKQIQSDQLRT